ncbi:putative manganese ion homeostasis (Fr) [Aspergillus clavatus NRRL 1]|uniref:Manganese ion homeostasis (Fr), putative n=1 Tax=Aspergillus clavatus (strain ATCC 1007 / CBS 513.65 / DSM 816 / NCTC 3887 / NRRL 1 / QM 1276 / 107) TaxID=344612 RepID=A1C788_ASPCL|nr:manganese ion homeostasis (Fr), putative [Aspergillus clavatus NRRL 1]EAW14259.1 manganese ion homeostasis (Fr), putative [Aspergillus clavatus NRRL 1]
MSYSYPRSESANAYRSARRDGLFDYSSMLARLTQSIPSWAKDWAADLHARRMPLRLSGIGIGSDGAGHRMILWRIGRRIFTVANALILLWFLTLWWGERTVFQDSLDACVWDQWEKWPRDANPHHVVFVADPQLVDPHTYPDRPWPLSTLTVKYSDQYLRRSFSTIQQKLGPDSVLFLGDLFDGGREWGTASSTSPEKRYQKYKDSFWKKEFQRFVRIFSDQFHLGDGHAVDPRGRRMIASLPGNHDLGFGTGVQIPVRDRFQSFFGKGNRVDVIGNHTFVSVDTVSLSAMDQPDPQTGSTGAGAGDGKQPNEHIWRETGDFLNDMQRHRSKAETEELVMLRNQSQSGTGRLFKHEAVDVSANAVAKDPQWEVVGLPTILLTHVPLYRRPATPCGPLRERHPPSAEGLEEDEPNSLTIAGGYQYQNVLTPTISKDLVSKVGPNLVQVYSGDDHDYCEISHREFSGSPREITVKSLSWAMGVRHPGFVLTSLWNPIDVTTGKSTERASSTIQNHLCLLPDQLGIFIYYGMLFGFTLFVLVVRAVVVVVYFPPPPPDTPLLPLTEREPYPSEPSAPSYPPSSSTSRSTLPSPRGLASRAVNAAPPRPPPSQPPQDAYPGLAEYEAEMNSKWKAPTGPSRRTRSTTPVKIRGELMGSVRFVAGVVFTWYFFLIWGW